MEIILFRGGNAIESFISEPVPVAVRASVVCCFFLFSLSLAPPPLSVSLSFSVFFVILYFFYFGFVFAPFRSPLATARTVPRVSVLSPFTLRPAL